MQNIFRTGVEVIAVNIYGSLYLSKPWKGLKSERDYKLRRGLL